MANGYSRSVVTMTDLDELHEQLTDVSQKLTDLSTEERTELMAEMDADGEAVAAERRQFLLGLGAISAGSKHVDRALSTVVEPTETEMPTNAAGTVSGTVNGVDFEAELEATIDPDTGRVDSRMQPVPAEVKGLISLSSIITVICWSVAVEEGDALNGYNLTGGNFTRDLVVTYETGEELRMVHDAGYSGGDTIDVTAELSGSVPEIGLDQSVSVGGYEEYYTQQDETTLSGVSDRVFYVDGEPFEYRWEPTISYDGETQMPGDQTQVVRDAEVGYDAETETTRIAMSNRIRLTE
jgi:hypothetical protein